MENSRLDSIRLNLQSRFNEVKNLVQFDKTELAKSTNVLICNVNKLDSFELVVGAYTTELDTDNADYKRFINVKNKNIDELFYF
jgi:hypothetical protein